MFKRAHRGAYHKMSKKHLGRYVDEFSDRQNVRELDTANQMTSLARSLVGKQLPYKELIVENGLNSGVRRS